MENTNFVSDFLEDMDNQPSPEVSSQPETTPAAEAANQASQPQEAVVIPPSVPREPALVESKIVIAGIPPITAETKTKPEQTEQKSAPTETVQESLLDDTDPFEAALKASENASKERVTAALAAKNPVFKHATVTEAITDADITFDDLRKKYETDFPELEDAKSISWTVNYGKVTETIAAPTKEKVYEVKAKIEQSDKFVAEIKKAKKEADKNPDCIVKPTVRAQKKGDCLTAMQKPTKFPSYKGFFTERDKAIESQKAISFVPARDGRIYEIRQNPIGIFQSPARAIGEFPDLTASFTPKLPKIPFFLLHQVIGFFREISRKATLEVLVHLVYDLKIQKYNVIVPKQKVTEMSVEAETEDYPEHVIHVMDIHSHNVMEAKFSPIDDGDEKATRLYGVIGRLNRVLPEISLRASNGGKFIELNADEIFDYEATYPEEWFDNVNHAMAEAICETEKVERCAA